MENIDPKYQGKINRMRNLPMFANANDQDILDHILKKEEEKKGIKATRPIPGTYEEKYNKLIADLRSEYGVDMNDSNDVESLKNLVRHILQLESIDSQIRALHQEGMDFNDSRTYKNLADIQRSLIMSISDLQDKLGISRKMRKDKASDDVPQFIEALKKKAGEFWDRKTVPVKCQKCEIELFRYWVNFPKLKNTVNLSLECWKCHEEVIFAR